MNAAHVSDVQVSIHAGGNLADGMLSKQTASSMRQAFAGKTSAEILLHSAVGICPISSEVC